MKKLEMDFLRERIIEVVRCTNGQVSTNLQGVKKGTGITTARQIKLIREGKATLKSDYDLVQGTSSYSSRPLYEELVRCYDFPWTDTQKKKIAFNTTIDSRIKEIHTEIELEGKRLLDKAVLGILSVTEIPDALLDLGSMVSLANTDIIEFGDEES